MSLAEHPLPVSEYGTGHRLGFAIAALVLDHAYQAVAGTQGIGMLGSQHLMLDGEQLAIALLGLLVPALQSDRPGEPVTRVEGIAVILAEDPDPVFKNLAVQILGWAEPSLVLDCV